MARKVRSTIPESTPPATLMLAYLCISKESEASLERKVEILDRFRLATGDIARVCGVQAQSVKNARLNLKKTKNASSRKKN
jgi:hypothetical protein